ncbi:MAG: MBL fold metallo-hydrolase [Trueperaceae bacterium]
MALHLETHTVGPLQENCTLLHDGTNAVFIDPGDEAQKLLQRLNLGNLNLQAIWLTHAHFDHIGAIADIQENLGDIPVYLHPKDDFIFKNAHIAAKRWEVPFKNPETKTLDLTDNQILEFAHTKIHCLFTPGHAPGHIAFYIPIQNLVISGDTLFKGSIGRTDLTMSNPAQLLESIRSKLLVLPDETVVYPGHGPTTTIGFEKQSNPFLI